MLCEDCEYVSECKEKNDNVTECQNYRFDVMTRKMIDYYSDR